LNRRFRASLSTARLWSSRGWRAASRHYLSFASGAVLTGALAAALTSSSFSRARPAPGLPAAAMAAASAATAVDPPPPRERAVVYYIFDDPMQRHVVQEAIQIEAKFWQDNGDPFGDVHVFFLRARTPEEDAEVARFLTFTEREATDAGYRFKVIDLRDN